MVVNDMCGGLLYSSLSHHIDLSCPSPHPLSYREFDLCAIIIVVVSSGDEGQTHHT